MNRIRINTLTVIVVGTLLAAGCGDSPAVGPTPTTAADVSGMWSGRANLTMVDGGGCVGMVLAAGIGLDATPVELDIEQTGARLMIATTNHVNQERCSYSGMVSGNVVTASMLSCDPAVLLLGAACAHLGDSRAWRKETLSVQFTGTVDGDVLIGTISETASVMSDEESLEVSLVADLTLMR